MANADENLMASSAKRIFKNKGAVLLRANSLMQI